MNTIELLIAISIPFTISVLSLILTFSFRAGYEKKYEEALREIKNLREEYMMGRIDAAASGAVFKAKKDIEGLTIITTPNLKERKP